MSNEDTAAGYGAVNIADVGKGAAADLKKFAKDMASAIGNSGASKDLQNDAMGKLQKVLSEVQTKPDEGAHSSAAKGGSVKHTDSVKANQANEAHSLTQGVGTAAGLVAAATGNPMARAIAEEFSPDALKIERTKNFDELKAAARKCGIKMIGKDPPIQMETACDNAQKNVETIAAIKSLRDNGFYGDAVYGRHEQLNAGGPGKVGEAAFVRVCAAAIERSDNKTKSLNYDDKETGIKIRRDFTVRPTPDILREEASKGSKEPVVAAAPPARRGVRNRTGSDIGLNAMVANAPVLPVEATVADPDLDNDDPADVAVYSAQPVRRSKRNASMILPGQIPMPGQSLMPGFVPNH